MWQLGNFKVSNGSMPLCVFVVNVFVVAVSLCSVCRALLMFYTQRASVAGNHKEEVDSCRGVHVCLRKSVCVLQ